MTSGKTPSCLDNINAEAKCYGTGRLCDGLIIRVDSTWSAKEQAWLGGQWIHRNLPDNIHPAHPVDVKNERTI